ncbi:hypothetical protein, partial [Ectopseudomonas oleovorans]
RKLNRFHDRSLMLGKITIQFRPLQQITQTEPFLLGLCNRFRMKIHSNQKVAQPDSYAVRQFKIWRCKSGDVLPKWWHLEA